MNDTTIPPTSTTGAPDLVFKEVCPSGEEHPPIGPPQTFVMQGGAPTPSNGAPSHPAAAAAVPLCIQGTTEVVAWACGACGTVAGSEPAAGKCCACHRCGGGGLPHEDCEELDQAAAQAKSALHWAHAEALKLVRAARVTRESWSGPVFFARAAEDTFYESIQHGLNSLPPSAQGPSWCWATTKRPFFIDAKSLYEDALEHGEAYGGAREQLMGRPSEAFTALIVRWNEHHGSKVTSYMLDHSVIVVLDEERFWVDVAAAVKLLADNEKTLGLDTLQAPS